MATNDTQNEPSSVGTDDEGKIELPIQLDTCRAVRLDGTRCPVHPRDGEFCSAHRTTNGRHLGQPCDYVRADGTKCTANPREGTRCSTHKRRISQTRTKCLAEDCPRWTRSKNGRCSDHSSQERVRAHRERRSNPLAVMAELEKSHPEFIAEWLDEHATTCGGVAIYRTWKANAVPLDC